MIKSKVFMVNTQEINAGDSLIDRLERLWNHENVKLQTWIQK